ncbi:MAG: MgtC/SapB family protein [Actinobacteria bacterium]|nr:MgtC/SapB family protein [Actinomycetota bacterium]
MPSQPELLVHLLVAAGLAGLLGMERELSEQPAGLRTHMLVGLGAALFAVIGAFGFQALVGRPGLEQVVRADVTRVASQIVVGIGFLGGGAILKYGASVKGLTTAANLWVTAAVGTAAGLGMLLIATFTTVLALLTLATLRPIRAVIRRYAPGHVELVVEADREVRVASLTQALREMEATVSSAGVEDHSTGRAFTMMVRLPRGARTEDAVARLTQVDGVRSVDWTG